MKTPEKRILEVIGIIVILLIILALFLLYPHISGSQSGYRVYQREVRNVPVTSDRSYTSSNGSSSTSSDTSYTSSTVQTQTTTYETTVLP